MAVTQATQLAEFSSGIGTAGAILEVDNVSNRIGIGTTNPQALLQVGDIIKMDGVTGVITATSFSGNVTGVSTGLTGTPDITVGNIVAAGATFSGVVTYEDVTNVDSLGIVTARTGLEVTANGLVINAGVSTFAADLSIADKIIHTGDTNTAIRFPSGDTFTVETSGVERLRVGSTGTVGVAGLSTATSFGAFNHLSAPFGGGTVSYTVTVATKTANHRYNGSGSSNGYLIDGVEAPFLTLTPGRTYRFVHDNTGSHPLKFYLEADKTTLYSTGVTFDNAYTEIVVSDSTPTILHYQCTNHGYMGNAVQVNSNISGGLVGTPDIDCGTGSFTGDVDIADKIIHTGDTNTAIRFPAADTFTVETGGSERLRVTSNVGVGDDNPSVKLNVKGSGDSLAGLNVHSKIEDTTSLAANVGGMLAFEGVYTSGDAEAVFSAIHGGKENATDGNYAGYLRAFTRPNGGLPAERLRIDSSGNVAIAAVSALGRLHVRPADECNFVVREESTSLVLSAETNNGRDNNRQMSLEGSAFTFTTSGNERLRVASSGQIGLGGANYGTSGQVLTSNGSGSAVTWEDAAGGGITTTKYSPAANAIIQIGLGTAQHHELRLSAGFTTVTTSGGSFGDSHSLVLVQPSSGICTVGFSTFFQFPSGATPSMSEGAGKVDLVSFVVKDIARNAGTGATELLASAGLNYQ